MSAAGEWTRLITFCNCQELYTKHVFFVYFLVNALFKRRLYSDILKLNLNAVIEAGLLLVLGRTYLMCQNRRAATSCLQGAVARDESCIEAFELIQKYRLYPKQFEEFVEKYLYYFIGPVIKID
ncbi:unnamed protein product [Gongylonema pulchrum]|uniref:TPR_REGION domain-containing protein n=1 Tax=Gongylonema pulchrum TaxID=637853 RepID=A0A3P6RPB3_9BILA|nr:unnamed protein product [Gongylonema pulchrum]